MERATSTTLVIPWSLADGRWQQAKKIQGANCTYYVQKYRKYKKHSFNSFLLEPNQTIYLSFSFFAMDNWLIVGKSHLSFNEAGYQGEASSFRPENILKMDSWKSFSLLQKLKCNSI